MNTTVFDVIDTTCAKGKRDYALFLLLWANVLRRGEVAKLTVRDFDYHENTLALSRDMCFFLQDGLLTPILSRFENLLQQSQKSRYLQRKIKPFEVQNAGFYTHPGSMPLSGEG